FHRALRASSLLLRVCAPLWSIARDTGRDQLLECPGAVTDGVFRFRLHLAEGQGVAVGLEHRVVAEAARAAGRPDQSSVHRTLKDLGMAVRPGKGERADEMRAA